MGVIQKATSPMILCAKIRVPPCFRQAASSIVLMAYALRKSSQSYYHYTMKNINFIPFPKLCCHQGKRLKRINACERKSYAASIHCRTYRLTPWSLHLCAFTNYYKYENLFFYCLILKEHFVKDTEVTMHTYQLKLIFFTILTVLDILTIIKTEGMNDPLEIQI